MNEVFQAVKLVDGVHWVGVIDWGLTDFHGYATPRGSTYNAFLVECPQGLVLIDGVKCGFEDELLSRIRSVGSLKEVKYVISNHSEMDHSGGIGYLMGHFAEDCKLLASIQGVKALQAHFHWDREVEALNSGEERILCGRSFKFIETKMLHWPDSMFTYLDDVGVLFSNDAFGMHLASSERFYDEVPDSVLFEEAERYYANILTPYSKLVEKLLAELPKFNLKLNFIAPDHGVIWRGEGIPKILDWYDRWGRGILEDRYVILYDTMWGSTKRMAEAIAEGISSQGISCSLFHARSTTRSEVARCLLSAKGLLVGAPTLNGEVFPSLMDILTYLRGLQFKVKFGGSFGSYGWACKSVPALDAFLKSMKIVVAEEGLSVQYVPDASALVRCREFGQRLAKTLQEDRI